MVPTTTNDVTVLETFVHDRNKVTPQQAASIISRIVQDAASPTGTSKQEFSAAQIALAKLCKQPSREAIPILLPICENNTSFKVLNVFVLASATWKAIVAASIQADEVVALHADVCIRIIQCAIASAQAMLSSGVLRNDTGDVTDLDRCVKIAKFYSMNAARCSKAFLNVLRDVRAVADILAQTLAKTLLLAGMLPFVSMFDGSVGQKDNDQIQREIAPLVGATLRNVLAIIGTKGTDGDVQQNIVSQSFECMSLEREEVSAPGNNPLSSMKVLSSILLMRYAISDPKNDTSEQTIRASAVCSCTFRTVLVPKLFQSFDLSYAELVSLHDRQSNTLFLDIVSEIVSQLIGIYGRREATDAEESCLMEDDLLVYITSPNATSAHVAACSLLAFLCTSAKLDSASETKQNERTFLDSLTCKILQCTRTSMALLSQHTDTRWIPLSAQVLARYIRAGMRVDEIISASKEEQMSKESGYNLVEDEFLIRILAPLCNAMKSCSGNSRGDEVRQVVLNDNEVLSTLLQSTAINREKLLSVVRDAALNHAKEDLCVAALSASRFTLHPTTRHGIAISLLTSGSNVRIATACVNAFQPAEMHMSVQHQVCGLINGAIERHGLHICPSVVALVSRAAESLGSSVSPPVWSGFARLLERSVHIAKSGGQEPMHGPVRAMLSASTMHHASVTLHYVSSKQRGNMNVSMPRSVLEDIEKVAEREMEWSNVEVDIGSRAALVNAERRFIQDEQSLQGNHFHDYGNADSSSVRHAQQAVVAAVGQVLGAQRWNEEVEGLMQVLQWSVLCLRREER